MDKSTNLNSLVFGILAKILGLSLLVGFMPAPALAMGELSLPVWEDLFNGDGTHKDRLDDFGMHTAEGNGLPDYIDYGAIDAIFIEDNISDGVATDMSLRSGAEALAEDVLFNGTVSAEVDLGNTYVLAILDSVGDLQLYAGVELLSPLGDLPPADTYVELEFTQDFIQAIGVNAPIRGKRSAGDLRVRMNFSEGVLGSVIFHQWETDLGYQTIETVNLSPGEANTCHAGNMPYVFCSGIPPLAAPIDGFEVWDLNNVPLTSVAPDGFVEVGLDVTALLGVSPEFSSVVIRTAQDIAIDSFRELGHWAKVKSQAFGEAK